MNRWDRIGHCLAFFALTMILKNFMHPFYAFGIAMLIGLLNEWFFATRFAPKRWRTDFDSLDFFANFIGCYSGLFIDLPLKNIFWLLPLWAPLTIYIFYAARIDRIKEQFKLDRNSNLNLRAN